jgi:hypothetical protein
LQSIWHLSLSPLHQYNERVSQLKAKCKEELAMRDEDIKRLKGLFSDEVHGQSEYDSSFFSHRIVIIVVV